MAGWRLRIRILEFAIRSRLYFLVKNTDINKSNPYRLEAHYCIELAVIFCIANFADLSFARIAPTALGINCDKK